MRDASLTIFEVTMTTSKSFRDVAEAELDKNQAETSEGTITNSDTQEQPTEVKTAPDAQNGAVMTNPVENREESIKPFADKPPLADKTPSQLEEIYQNWQKKYTQQRQTEKAELKKYQAEMAKLQKQLDERQQYTQPAQGQSIQSQKDEVARQYELGNMSLEQYTAYMKDLVSQDVLSQVSAMQQAQYEEIYQNGLLNEFFTLDERLDQNNPNYSPRFLKMVTSEMAEQLDSYIANNGTSQGFPVKELAQKIITEYDNEVNEMMKTRVQSNAQIARAKAASTARNTPGGTSATTKSTAGRSFKQILEEQDAG